MAQITVAQIAWNLLWLVASTLIARALAPRPPNVEGPRTDNLNVSGSAYGAPIPRGWGTVRLGGNIIESAPIREQINTQRVGGKGGGNSSTVTTYTYFWTGAVSVGRGPISEVLRIWADTKLVFDRTASASATVQREGWTLRIYKGTETQAVDAAIQALHADPTDALPYRGLAYVVFDDIPLADFGNRVPQWSFEVAWASTPVQNAIAPTELVGGPLDAHQAPLLLVDWERDRYFLQDHVGIHGIRAFRISTNTEYMQQVDSVAYGSGIDTTAYGLAAISPDGYLFASTFITLSTVRVFKLDAVTLTTVATTLGPSGYPPIQQNVFATATGLYGTEHYLIYRGVLFRSTFHVMSGADLTFTGTLTVAAREALKLGRGVTTNGNAIAWAVAYDDALSGTTNGLQIYKITQPPRTITLFVPAYQSPTLTLTASIALADIDATWTRTTDVSAPLYDEADGNLIFNVQGGASGSGGETWRLVKVDPSTGAIVWNIATTNLVIYDDQHAYSRVDGRYAATLGSNSVLLVDTIAGTTTTETFSGLPNIFTGAEIYNARRDAMITSVFGNGSWVLLFGRAGAAPIALSTIVQDICTEAGFSGPDFDVTQLTDSVRGYLLNTQAPGRSALEPLAIAFDFDGVESDDTIKFVKRGAGSVVTIPQDDLVIEKQADALKETRVQEVDLPERVSIVYLDQDQDYQQGTQQSKRIALPTPSMYSRNEVSESLPIVFNAQEAKRVADKQLFSAWVEREQQTFQLSQRYLKYDPCDVVTIAMESGVNYKSRVMQWDVGANCMLDARGISEEPSTFTSPLLADGGVGFDPPPLSAVDPTRLFVLDSPLLRDEDSTGGVNSRLYYAGAGDTPAGTWTSAAVYSSSDGAAWDQHDPLLAEVAWGAAVTALGDTAFPFQTDTVNTVTVLMIDGADQLQSVTELQMLNGANPAILLNPATGELEVIQYQTVTGNVDGTYTLSRLLRGRRGTDTMTGVHGVGSYFLIPAVGTFRATRVGLDQLNVERTYRAVTSGQLFENGFEVPNISTGRDLKPYAPVNVRASPSGSDITIGWDRRTRMGGALIDGTGDVPLHEDTEAYDIDIYNGAGTTVLRTLTAGTESCTYAAAQIATDFGVVPLTLTLAVYQRSAYVGRGFGRQVTVEVR